MANTGYLATLSRSRRTSSPGFVRPFVLLLVTSILLLLLRNTEVVRGASTFATQALVPFQRMVAEAGASANRVGQSIGEIDRLRTDNATLRQRVDQLTLENVQLRERAFAAEQAAQLATAARKLEFESVIAPVISRDPSGLLHTIVLGVGTDDGVRPDDIVVSDQGVVGRVTEVGTNYSKVLLVTDSGSAVSALVQGSRAAGLVRGQYGDTLVMDWILQAEAVKVGDVVITAGLSVGNELRSLYPKGLVLGHVVDVSRAEAAAFQRAVIAPAVDLRHLENVLVVKTVR
jgi:rod shape-determining protein MreC